MINISHEHAQEMYIHLLNESMRNVRMQSQINATNPHHCPNMPRGNVQARVTGIITVEEHYRIVEQGDADMLYLEAIYNSR